MALDHVFLDGLNGCGSTSWCCWRLYQRKVAVENWDFNRFYSVSIRKNWSENAWFIFHRFLGSCPNWFRKKNWVQHGCSFGLRLGRNHPASSIQHPFPGTCWPRWWIVSERTWKMMWSAWWIRRQVTVPGWGAIGMIPCWSILSMRVVF